MIQSEKIKLLKAWEKDFFSELSISEIMTLAEKRTKPWVFNSLNLLVKNRLLVSRKKGNINLYRLNLENPFLIQTLQYLDLQENLLFPRLEIIIEAINKIPVKNFCLLVFGSYANKKQKTGSDLDICFLVENKEVEKMIKPYFDDIKLNYALGIDEHFITFSELKEMLLRDEENLAKQIFRKKILFFNAEIYYQLIKEAYKNGFRP